MILPDSHVVVQYGVLRTVTAFDRTEPHLYLSGTFLQTECGRRGVA